MAFTTTLLAWSVIEFGDSMGNEIENARAAVRWGSDYLLKAATAAPDVLYVQVSRVTVNKFVREREERKKNVMVKIIIITTTRMILT